MVLLPVTVGRGDISVSIQATGTVQPKNRLEIQPPISGRIEKVLVVEGDYVKKGTILAWMSSTERAALLDAARATGDAEVKHWEELYKATPLIAPLSGEIIARNIEPGQTVGSGTAVLVMNDYLIVKAQVDETDIGKIRVGQKAVIKMDAYPDQSIKAEVNHIAYEAKTSNNVTVYEIDVLPGNTPKFLRSGMTADVDFIISAKKNIVIVPEEAVTRQGTKATVLVPDRKNKGKSIARELKLGITDGKNSEVLHGLAEGDTILQYGIPELTRKKQQDSNPFMMRGPGGNRSTTRSGSGTRSGGGGRSH
jgi:macrolide-specific efflux system membrane fusion protein